MTARYIPFSGQPCATHDRPTGVIMRRVMRNNSRVGKAWLVVEGSYVIGHLQWAKHGAHGRRTWHTTLQLSEHDFREQAESALAAVGQPQEQSQ